MLKEMDFKRLKKTPFYHYFTIFLLFRSACSPCSPAPSQPPNTTTATPSPLTWPLQSFKMVLWATPTELSFPVWPHQLPPPPTPIWPPNSVFMDTMVENWNKDFICKNMFSFSLTRISCETGFNLCNLCIRSKWIVCYNIKKGSISSMNMVFSYKTQHP